MRKTKPNTTITVEKGRLAANNTDAMAPYLYRVLFNDDAYYIGIVRTPALAARKDLERRFHTRIPGSVVARGIVSPIWRVEILDTFATQEDAELVFHGEYLRARKSDFERLLNTGVPRSRSFNLRNRNQLQRDGDRAAWLNRKRLREAAIRNMEEQIK